MPMRAAAEYQVIRPGLYFWQVYDPTVKTELCCCALETGEGLFFCDPVALDGAALEELVEEREPRGIVLTNGNHERNAAALARQFGIEVWAHEGARGEVAATRWFRDGEVLFGSVETVGLRGFAAGETALWQDGVLLMGDALIHAEPYGFAMLPEKYCEDAKAGRESLKKLLRYPVEIVVFAHGLPIVARARERLAGVIG
jgi:glyoxylase-like metal-dependent hydrolase (beta-lactamase superfamily II)